MKSPLDELLASYPRKVGGALRMVPPPVEIAEAARASVRVLVRLAEAAGHGAGLDGMTDEELRGYASGLGPRGQAFARDFAEPLLTMRQVVIEAEAAEQKRAADLAITNAETRAHLKAQAAQAAADEAAHRRQFKGVSDDQLRDEIARLPRTPGPLAQRQQRLTELAAELDTRAAAERAAGLNP